MQLRSKYYTYPVITEDADFYIDSSFTSDVDQDIDGYNIVLILRYELKNPGLEELMKAGKVKVAHHIECLQTCYRKLILTEENEHRFVIRDGEVNGKVQVCSFLVAMEDIPHYSNELFSQDYKGFNFNIEHGCVMAVGSQIDLRINKIKDDLANTSSIFSIIPNYDETVTNIIVDISRNKIVISVPEKSFAIYSNMSATMDIQPIMHSMLIIPALTYALTELKESKDELYNYEDYRWFRSLRKACEQINISFEESIIENIKPFDLAQKLLDSPIPKAMDYLGGDTYED